MKYLYLGKIVNTHGIKGEIRIVSNFDRKALVFKKNFPIYIGNAYKKEIIETYRIHKNYDMVTLKNINDINEVLKYKELKVYINRDDLDLKEDEYILDDLLGFKIISENAEYGFIEDIFDNKKQILLSIKFEKHYYIPYNSNYIKEVDLKNKIVYVNQVKELIL